MLKKAMSVWDGADKKTVKIFALYSLAVWVFMVVIFYGIAKWNEPKLDNFDVALLDPIEQGPTYDEEPALKASLSATPALRPERDLEDAMAHKKLMEIFYQRGDMSSAALHASRVSGDYSKDTSFQIIKSQAHLHAGEYANALHASRTGLELAPANSQLKSIEIESLYRLNRKNEALEKGRAYLSSHPEDPRVLTSLGVMGIESDPRDNRYLLRALKAEPSYRPAKYHLGRYHRLVGNYADAKSWIKKYIESNPADAKARGQMGAVHFYLRETKSAIKEYETALALNPRDYNTWYNLGELYLHTYNSELHRNPGTDKKIKAFECYRKSLELFPGHLQANYRVGVLLNGNRQFKEAIGHLEIVLDQEPNHFRALIQIALAYENINRSSEAVEYLTKAYKLDPGNSLVIHKLKILS